MSWLAPCVLGSSHFTGEINREQRNQVVPNIVLDEDSMASKNKNEISSSMSKLNHKIFIISNLIDAMARHQTFNSMKSNNEEKTTITEHIYPLKISEYLKNIETTNLTQQKPNLYLSCGHRTIK
jgi:hypothetical protein